MGPGCKQQEVVPLAGGRPFFACPKKGPKKGQPGRPDDPGRRTPQPSGRKLAALKQFAPSPGCGARRPAGRQRRQNTLQLTTY